MTALVMLTLGCSEVSSPSSVTRPLIYGDDDRQDLFQVENEQVRGLALSSSAALVPAGILDREQGPDLLSAGGLARSLPLCDDERFGAQPNVARCSGTLIDDDLILTAGHCASALGGCVKQTWVFGYGLVAADELDVGPDDIHWCRRLVAHEDYDDADGSRVDYALIQLDRPVGSKRSAAPLAAAQAERGERVVVIGYPLGVPIKVDEGASILDARSDVRDYIAISSDTYEGSSGSGVFNVQGELLATLVRGRRDFDDDLDTGCKRSRRLEAEGSGGEQASYGAPAIAKLCERGWTSERLCQAADRCGDDQCGLTEHAGSCAEDCPEVPFPSPTFPRAPAQAMAAQSANAAPQVSGGAEGCSVGLGRNERDAETGLFFFAVVLACALQRRPCWG